MDSGTETTSGRRRVPGRRALVALAVLTAVAGGPAWAEEAAQTLRLETTTVTGNRELPRVMVIVPWKQALPGDLPGRPAQSLLDEALAPIDRRVFRREINFYESLESATLDRSASTSDASQGNVEESGG